MSDGPLSCASNTAAPQSHRVPTVYPDRKSDELLQDIQHHIQSQPIEGATVSFLTANRVVAALKKAVGRLELLTLLDTTAPDDGYNSTPFANNQRPSGNTSPPTGQLTNANIMPRKAAFIVGEDGEAANRGMRELNRALQVASTRQRTVRPTVGELVEEQKLLERRYGELLLKAGRINPKRNGPSLDPSCFAAAQDLDKLAVMEELKQTSKRLREHNKILFTRLKDNPNDSDNWKKVGNERGELIELLQSVIRELTAGYYSGRAPSSRTTASHCRGSWHRNYSGTNESLCTEIRDTGSALPAHRFGSSVQLKRAARSASGTRIPMVSSYEKFAKLIADEQSAQRWASELVLKEKELNQNVKQLQQELRTQKQLREKEVSELRQRVAELRQNLREEKKISKQVSDMARAAAEASHEAMQRAADEKSRVVLDEMQADRATDIMEDRSHNAFKEHLLERTEAMDFLAMQWDKKNQHEVKRAEARKIDLEQMRQQCAVRLQKAREDKEVELARKLERDAEREKIEKEKQEEERRRNIAYEATSKIQSAIRAMFTRRAVAILRKKANKLRRKAQKGTQP
uniref:Uncharacterized protein TCIL3000_11_10990 n=1 Tax=Trypanosoma congolense (strain IL3000) TaxID=1068625 RepID=G0V1U5_TRYCI|nr:unnamed protein product [Trypanosoma congolense IL3000]